MSRVTQEGDLGRLKFVVTLVERNQNRESWVEADNEWNEIPNGARSLSAGQELGRALQRCWAWGQDEEWRGKKKKNDARIHSKHAWTSLTATDSGRDNERQHQSHLIHLTMQSRGVRSASDTFQSHLRISPAFYICKPPVWVQPPAGGKHLKYIWIFTLVISQTAQDDCLHSIYILVGVVSIL